MNFCDFHPLLHFTFKILHFAVKTIKNAASMPDAKTQI